MVPWMDHIDNHSVDHSAADTPPNNAPRMSNPVSAVSEEFEFIVAYDRDAYAPSGGLENIKEGCPQRHHPNAVQVYCDQAVKNHMIEVLRLTGLEVNNLNQIPPNYTKWTVDDDDSIDSPDVSESPDSSIFGKWFASIELKTPKMPYCFASMETVIHTLEVIRRNFTCVTNQSCGLHVHVGNAGPDGNSRGFALSTLKTLATLATVFNRQFNSLHPYHRIANVHCRSVAQNFPESDPWDIASTIGSARTTDELVDMMNGGENSDDRGFAINFRSLIDERGLRTLEFRQHEATLDTKSVSIWLSLVCGLLLVCHGLTPAQLRNFVIRHEGQSEEVFGITHLLAELGLGNLANFYARRGVYLHPRMVWE